MMKTDPPIYRAAELLSKQQTQFIRMHSQPARPKSSHIHLLMESHIHFHLCLTHSVTSLFFHTEPFAFALFGKL